MLLSIKKWIIENKSHRNIINKNIYFENINYAVVGVPTDDSKKKSIKTHILFSYLAIFCKFTSTNKI
jgi:hypothetical protein